MKRQILSLMAGAALIVTPFISTIQPASAQGFGGGGLPGHMMKDLNLTEAQKSQLQAIREKTRSRIEAVLTDAQKQQLATLKQQKMAERQQRAQNREQGQGQPQGRGKRGGMKGGMFASLNLTEQQKAQIKTIMQESRKEAAAVLTAEQKAKIRQKVAEQMNDFLN